MSKVCKPFTMAKTKYFDAAELDVSDETRDRLAAHINDKGGREDVAALL